MGLLDGTTQQDYYQGNEKGGYQFTSLEDVINQFLVAYVGEEKVIGKASRIDVAFHAQRAMQELSFDTFKSIKSQEIVLPPSNTMILPHDYVNYTRVMWSDEAGIKHPLYPTRDTQNPFSIKQNSDGSYYFNSDDINVVINGDFAQALSTGWSFSSPGLSNAWDGTSSTTNSQGTTKYFFDYISDKVEINTGALQFDHLWFTSQLVNIGSRSYGCWQKLDVSNINNVSLTADGTSSGQILDGTTVLCDNGVLRVGISTTDPSVGWENTYSGTYLNNATNNAANNLQNNTVDGVVIPVPIFDSNIGASPSYLPGDPIIDVNGVFYHSYTTASINVLFNPKRILYFTTVSVPATHTNPYNATYPSPNIDADKLDLGYVEWSDGSSSQEQLLDIDVSVYDYVWVYIQSYSPWTAAGTTTATGTHGGTTVISPLSSANNTHQSNIVDNISVSTNGAGTPLSSADTNGNSTTWNNYKSHSPNNNSNPEVHSYDTDIYDFNIGERYGLDPQHAQVNGSYYIDNLRGLINFSSNVSGKTVILDYISDSLGTDGEMQVHKFAEEAMYKWIMYAILSTRANVPEYIVRRYQKEKSAATRTAKLRLSNIKLEELTQILRGKSKHIKH